MDGCGPGADVAEPGFVPIISSHETPISAFQDSSQTAVGIPCPHVDQERAQGDPSSSPKGSSSVDRRLIGESPRAVGSPALSFRRRQRLQGSRVFSNIRAVGEHRVCGSLIMNWLRISGSREVRLGIVTGRRIGGSVVRSRARRMMREAFRLFQHQIEPGVDIILVARASLVGRPLTGVSKDLLRCLREAGLWMNPTPTSSTSQCAS